MLNDTQGFLKAQSTAFQAAHHVSRMLAEGWTEKQAARLLNTYLMDLGVRTFFHESFAWFGDRTRFDGIQRYKDFSPSARTLRPGQVVILDVAPIVEGYICDIGVTSCFGPNAEYDRAASFLKNLKEDLPAWALQAESGAALCERVENHIQNAGYENIHTRYPFSVLGHRVHRTRTAGPRAGIWNFGWQAFWELGRRGVRGQLLNRGLKQPLRGLWAIEPHLGGPGFGVKFEQILCVEPNRAYWLGESAARQNSGQEESLEGTPWVGTG